MRIKIIISIFILLFSFSAFAQTLDTNVCEDEKCDTAYKIGDVIILTAEPDPGLYFAGWITDVSGCTTGECTIKMSEIKTYRAKAIFAEYPREVLHVYVFGKVGGKVTSADSSMSCEVKDDSGTLCEFSFLRGTKVALTAIPPAGGKFTWRGLGCSGTGTCSTTLTKTKTLNVRFY